MEKSNLRAEVIRLFILLGIIVTLAGFIAGNAIAEPPTVADIVAEAGCAMAHCDQGLTDDTLLSASLSGEVVDFWRDADDAKQPVARAAALLGLVPRQSGAGEQDGQHDLALLIHNGTFQKDYVANAA